MDRSKLSVVDRFASQAEADLAKSVLESAGIDVMIQADRAGGMRDHLAWSGLGFKVLVREEDATEAHELLEPLPEAPLDNLVTVQSFASRAQAEVAKDALESAGIAVELQADITGSVLSLGQVRLFVHEEDAAKAHEVLNLPPEVQR